MKLFPDFRDVKVMYETSYYTLLRAVRIADALPVIIRAINLFTANADEVARFRKECDLVNALGLEGVLAPIDVRESETYLYAVFADFDSRLLTRYCGKTRLELAEVLSIAIRLVGILGEVHAARRVIGILNPNLVLYSQSTGKLKLLSLGAVETGEQNVLQLDNAHFVEHSLPYIAPEVAIRKREIDYRADFFSFGSIFYSLLSGRLPFHDPNPLKTVTAIVTAQPISLYRLDKNYPAPVIDIIAKLMSKNPRERYQSVWGINADLERCLDQYTSSGKIYHFSLGQNDVSSHFAIPDKLVGRDAEIRELTGALHRVMKGSREVCLISGFSGIGKSELVMQAFAPVEGRKNRLLHARFEQMQNDRPFAPILHAFIPRIRQILGNEVIRNEWKTRILEALESNGQMLIDLIPDLEKLIGCQTPSQPAGAIQNQNRFYRVFMRFVTLFARQGEPLVLFLDDLQWADTSAVKLLEKMLLDEQFPYFLFIGAYRDSEVTPDMPVNRLIERLKNQKTLRVNALSLQPLTSAQIYDYLKLTFSSTEDDISSLARLVEQKTAGNPFFIGEFLKSLNNEILVFFDSEQAKWCWDLAEIQSKDIASSVVDFLAGKISRLKIETQQLLMLAACLGLKFDLFTLAMVSENTLSKTSDLLHEALESGVVVVAGEISTQVDISTLSEDGLVEVSYQFRHDRIRQAVLSLIFKQSRPAIHLQVGRLLLEGVENDPHSLDDKLFDIVNQLNLAVALIDDQKERAKLVRLNQRAGIKARKSTAYMQSLRYFQYAIAILPVTGWQEELDAVSLLYYQAVEAAFLAQQYDMMERFSAELRHHQHKPEKLAEVNEVIIHSLIVRNRPSEAVDLILHTCRLLGYGFSRFPGKFRVALSLFFLKRKLFEKSTEDFLRLPEMNDERLKRVIRLIVRYNSAIYISAPELFAYLMIKVTRWQLDEGLVPESPLAFASLGILFNGTYSDFEHGKLYGETALRLLERPHEKSLDSRVLMVVSAFILPWTRHAADVIKPLQKAYRTGLEQGDFDFAAFALSEQMFIAYSVGKSLLDLDAELTSRREEMARLGQHVSLHYFNQLNQFVHNLLGKSDDPCLLIGEHYNEEVSLGLHLKTNDRNSVFTLNYFKMLLSLQFGAYHSVLDLAASCRQDLPAMSGWLGVVGYYFAEALACVRLAGMEGTDKAQRKAWIKIVISHHEKIKVFARHAPMNHQHKIYLIQAELYRLAGQEMKAAWAYGESIRLARDTHYINDQMLATEWGARFFLDSGREQIAVDYMRDTILLGKKWGALAKVAKLEEEWSDYL